MKYAGDLSNDDAGMDVTITVDGILTGGVIRSVRRVFGMVRVDIDGQLFVLPIDKPIELVSPTAGQLLAMPLEDRPNDHVSRRHYDDSCELASDLTPSHAR